ncbi:MAG: hypothetical protein KA715_03770 [Xanthomonadaceae bacterium]|nr:hypothetical protein [Xanthomonadaceae bacterium]
MGKKPSAKEETGLEVCTVTGCKTKPAQFSFCLEHFDHYKFGLINKKGQQVPDFEKKFDQYMKNKDVAIRKVA